MQASMTMPAFLAEVERRELAHVDYLVGPRKMLMADDNDLSIEGLAGTLPMLPNAHAQVSAKLGVPKGFYDDLPGRAPGLRASIINRLLAEDTRSTRLVRTLDGRARAIQSDSFKPMDNFVMLRGALPVIQAQGQIEIVATQLSDTRMYLQFNLPRLEGEVRVGEVVRAGVILTNSEVGQGAFDVRRVLFKLACRNGMIGQSLMRKTHSGSRLENDDGNTDGIFKNDTLEANMRALSLQLRDLLTDAFTQAAFDTQLAVARKAAGAEVKPTEIEATVRAITSQFNLTKAEGEGVLAGLWAEPGRTRWDIANAVTALVHTEAESDRQYDLERVGHDLVTLDDAAWARFAKAVA